MNRFLLLLFLFIGIIISGAQGKKRKTLSYPCASIAQELKKNASAVIRNYSHTYELKNYGNAIEEINIAITILNKAGKDFSNLFLPYDNNTEIISLSGDIYNQFGFHATDLKKDEIRDYNYTSGGHLYDDIRVKVVEPAALSYPYTVEYKYVKEQKGIIGYPSYFPIDNYEISVEKSEFTFKFPIGSKIRYRERNIESGCREESVDGDINVYKWSFKSLPAIEDEPYSPWLHEIVPNVILAPHQFSYEGISGKMDNWENYGKWIYDLIKDRDELPEKRVTEIKSLISGISDTAKIVSTLYKYMQGHTRYVGVQMGLGGLQPFPAKTVSEVGYGDCKALSNYMKAILKVADIKSYYTTIGSGRKNPGITMIDFPAKNYSNHAILCVPVSNDTIWLECTSQDMPCGYLGSANNNKTVLLVTENGGKLARTPVISQSQNFQFRKAIVKIDSTGKVEAEVKTRYGGEQYDNIYSILDEKPEEQKKALYKSFDLSGVAIKEFSFSNIMKPIPEATEDIAFSVNKYAAKTKNRLFIPLNILNRHTYIPPNLNKRTTPVIKRMSFHDVDTITYDLPSGYVYESLPGNKSFKSVFGEYNTFVESGDNQIQYIRELIINKGEYPAESYDDLIEFYRNISRADRVKIVLKEE